VVEQPMNLSTVLYLGVFSRAELTSPASHLQSDCGRYRTQAHDRWPIYRNSAQARTLMIWRSKPRSHRYVEVFKSASIGAEKAQSDHRYRLVSLSRKLGFDSYFAAANLIYIKSDG
jgi:hypothetical protein